MLPTRGACLRAIVIPPAWLLNCPLLPFLLIHYCAPCRQNKSVDKPEESTEIDINEPVALTFALRYLNSFAKVCACRVSQGRLGPAVCLAHFAPKHVAACCCSSLPSVPPSKSCPCPSPSLLSRVFASNWYDWCTQHAMLIFAVPAWFPPPPPQATPLAPHVVLKLSKDLPVVVEYHIPDVGRCVQRTDSWPALVAEWWYSLLRGAAVGLAVCRRRAPPPAAHVPSLPPPPPTLFCSLGFLLAPKGEEEDGMQD